jgi:hypothetical protein
MSDLDNWLERPYHEGEEPPDNKTIKEDYECENCGGPFTEEDLDNENIELIYDWEGWRSKHIKCGDELDE